MDAQRAVLFAHEADARVLIGLSPLSWASFVRILVVMQLMLTSIHLRKTLCVAPGLLRAMSKLAIYQKRISPAITFRPAGQISNTLAVAPTLKFDRPMINGVAQTVECIHVGIRPQVSCAIQHAVHTWRMPCLNAHSFAFPRYP
jgi:hypothetical protein